MQITKLIFITFKIISRKVELILLFCGKAKQNLLQMILNNLVKFQETG